jgi:hypothetical protein
VTGAGGALLDAPLAGALGTDGGAVAPAPLRIGSCVCYSKADAFEICGALALAESALRASGRETEATLLAAVFQVAEAGLARV